jgi:simple sugar transport system permease protein
MALVVSAALIVLAGASPWVAYASLFEGAFGSVASMAETIAKAIPLMLVGLGITIAFRCKVWNIGGEGQLIMGAIVATWVGIALGRMPALLLLPSIVALGFVAGALWGAMAGVLKARLEVNEVIVTIMMNYVAIYGLNYLVRGPMRDPTIAGGFPQSPRIAPSAELPRLIPATRLHAGVLIALLGAILVYVFLFRTPLGYEVRAVGANPRAARYGGISVMRNIVLAMFLSGGLAGIAGAGEICGLHFRLLDGISTGYGYTGIVVALLGKLHPFGVILAAFFFGAMVVGMEAMQRTIGTPFALVLAIEGLVVLFMLSGEVLTRYRIRRV